MDTMIVFMGFVILLSFLIVIVANSTNQQSQQLQAIYRRLRQLDGPTRRTRPRRFQPAVPASTSRTPQCGLGSYTFTPKNPHAQVGTPPLPSDNVLHSVEYTKTGL